MAHYKPPVSPASIWYGSRVGPGTVDSRGDLAAVCDGARQIGATPNRGLCPATKPADQRCRGSLPRTKTCCSLQDLDSALELGVLALQLPDASVDASVTALLRLRHKSACRLK